MLRSEKSTILKKDKNKSRVSIMNFCHPYHSLIILILNFYTVNINTELILKGKKRRNVGGNKSRVYESLMEFFHHYHNRIKKDIVVFVLSHSSSYLLVPMCNLVLYWKLWYMKIRVERVFLLREQSYKKVSTLWCVDVFSFKILTNIVMYLFYLFYILIKLWSSWLYDCLYVWGRAYESWIRNGYSNS